MANRTISRYPTGLETYRVVFEYLSRQFVVVTLVNTADESLNKVLKPVDDYVFDSPTIIRLKAPQTGFDAVQIHRFTNVVPLVDFRDGSVLTASDLTVAELQAIHIAEEGRDQTIDLAKEYTDIAVDASNKAQGILDQILALGSDSTDRVWAENRYQLKDYTPIETGSLSEGGILTSASSAIKDTTSGLYWAYVGTFPHTVAADTDPSTDPNFHCVGRLGQLWEFNDSRNWYTPSYTVDNTVPLGLFLKAMQHHSLTANIVGPVLTSKRITCDCDIDASDCDWYISPDSDDTYVGGSGAVLVIRDEDTVETTGNPFATSNIGQTSHVQLSGPLYANRTVGVIGEGDNNRAYLRNGTSYTNAMDLYVMDGGGTGLHPDTPALFRFYDTATFITRPLRPLRTIKGPRFIMTDPLSGNRVLRTCIKIERNNTTLDGGYFDAQSNGVRAESYVSPQWVTQCTIKNVTMPSSQTTQATYTILAQGTNRLTVINCHAPTGWALVDGNFMRNTVVVDSSGATIGCHAMAWNFTVKRCTITPVVVSGRYQGGISVTGGGNLIVEDLHYVYMGGERALDHPVATRGDYGQAWEGDITIDRITITYAALPASGQSLAILYLQGAVNGSVDLTRNCFLGKKINISNITVNIANASWPTSEVIFNTAYFQTTGTQTVHYPSEYNVTNMEVYRSGVPTSAFTVDPRWNLLISGDYVTASSCKMVFKNVRWPSTSVGFIGPAAGITYKITPELIIEDSKGAIYINQLALAAGSVTFRKTNIGSLTLGNAQGKGNYYFERCNIAGKCGGSPASTDKAYYYENHITTTTTVEIGSIAKYCHGNTIASGGAITGRSVDEWWSYRDPAVFRTA